ncbi:methyltransferase domain-containing protein [Paludisphaera soli]|uniref:methyltransferase domain-containing protein n=1 Tax=Paludisphaera soli TaxID=2712865 RepID=UPI0013EB48C6|nr:methyltransferase domain-containing protein [Paludisphaera soli]
MRLLPDLRERRRRPELMDQPGLDPAEHRRALDALRRVNLFSVGARAVWPRIRAFHQGRLREDPSRPTRLLDVASGGGDFPVRLARLARREGLDLEIAGCDVSEFAVGHASEHARRSGVDVRFFRADVLADPFPEGYDVVTCSLFLHHLDEPEAVALLAAMRDAARLVLIDDLERGRLGYALAYAGIRILSRSSVAHVDGPLSVEGAFTRDEARELARKAGWPRPEVVPRFPCRFLLSGGGA